MFRFAYANMNNGNCFAAANCAEAVFSCAASSCAANTCAMSAANMLNKMDAALAASISICLISLIGLISLRVLGLSILGLISLIMIRRAESLGKSQA